MSRSRGKKNRSGSYYPTQPASPNGQPVVEPIRRGEVLNLGELGGTERAPLTASFQYFGQTIDVHPDLSELDVIDFFESSEAMGSDEAGAMLLIKSFVRRIIAPADFDRFWLEVKSRRQTAQEVMTLMFAVIEGVSGNPSSAASDSSAGHPVTTPSSQPAASSPADPNEELRNRFIAQIERFEAMGTGMGAAMAAQIATAAEARGVDVTRAPVLSSSGSD